MRTNAEILLKIKESKNNYLFLGGFLCEYLDFENVKEFLKEGVTIDQWQARSKEKESILSEMLNYMPFAWEKANNCRGISAGRSIEHYIVWLWLIGDDQMAEDIKSYDLYGKPQLKKICERFGWDWRGWHDGYIGNDAESLIENKEIDL